MNFYMHWSFFQTTQSDFSPWYSQPSSDVCNHEEVADVTAAHAVTEDTEGPVTLQALWLPALLL